MPATIETVTARDRLKPRREPYWHRIERGCYLGYRRMTKGSAGSWIARAFDPETRKQLYKPLGAIDVPAHEQFDAAARAARQWFEHLGRGGRSGVTTIRDVCSRYVERIKSEKAATARPARAKPGQPPTTYVPAAKDAEDRFKAYVLNVASFADLDITKAQPRHFEEWRKALAKRPVRGRPNDGGVRSASTLNRDMTPFRAALNLAKDDGYVTTDFAWKAKLKPIENADGRRELYLDRVQRQRLVEKAEPDLALLLRGLSLVPLRPAALAGLKVSDFDKRLHVLRIGKDKAGADRRITLPLATSKFFAEQSKDKLPTAPLLSRADGKAWDKDAWKKPVKAAVKAAKLPDETTAYTLRHSTITDLVTAAGLDLLTVARLSGTSVKMIERHYGHLRAEHAAAALATLA